MKFSESEWNLATANKIQRQRMGISDSEWNLATANEIQRQRMEFSDSELKFNDSELKFSDSEFRLVTAIQIQRILKQMDDHSITSKQTRTQPVQRLIACANKAEVRVED